MCCADRSSPSHSSHRAQFFTATTGPARVTQAQNLLYNEDDGCLSGSAPGDDLDWSPDGARVVTALQLAGEAALDGRDEGLVLGGDHG